jgi:phosphoglycerate dehydrogenase-like enzyme
VSIARDVAFDRIVVLDDCRLTPSALDEVARLARHRVVIYQDVPDSEQETIRRIEKADCVLVSWRTPVGAAVLRAAPALKYVGMCCSLYDERAANVDIQEARALGIDVRGVRDYGDEGTVEFIFAQLISLLKGLGPAQWRPEPAELTEKRIGVIGFGTVGQMVARTAVHFGMHVVYCSPRRKNELESERISYMPLDGLLETCDSITIHVPRNTVLLHQREFRLKKPNSILVNTSLGLTFDKDAFVEWLEHDPSSFAILDADGAGAHAAQFSALPNVLFTPHSAGFSSESRQRLSQKVLANMVDHLNRA